MKDSFKKEDVGEYIDLTLLDDDNEAQLMAMDEFANKLEAVFKATGKSLFELLSGRPKTSTGA